MRTTREIRRRRRARRAFFESNDFFQLWLAASLFLGVVLGIAGGEWLRLTYLVH